LEEQNGRIRKQEYKAGNDGRGGRIRGGGEEEEEEEKGGRDGGCTYLV